MARDDVEGAIAAAQYFLELYPYAYNTGDLSEWRAMSHPECIFCASVAEKVASLHRVGGYEVGGRLIPQTVSAREPLPGNEFFAVDFTLQQEPGVKFGPGGAQIESFEGGAAIGQFAIAKGVNAWLVREVSVGGSP